MSPPAPAFAVFAAAAAGLLFRHWATNSSRFTMPRWMVVIELQRLVQAFSWVCWSAIAVPVARLAASARDAKVERTVIAMKTGADVSAFRR